MWQSYTPTCAIERIPLPQPAGMPRFCRRKCCSRSCFVRSPFYPSPRQRRLRGATLSRLTDSVRYKWGRAADRLYFPNAECPRGFVGGIARSEQFFSPHFEHRILLATSTSLASQPQILPNVCGSAIRSWPQAEHVKTKVYCPNSSLNLLIRISRAMTRIVATERGPVHPVLERHEHWMRLSPPFMAVRPHRHDSAV
jgi:hypothetical protein